MIQIGEFTTASYKKGFTKVQRTDIEVANFNTPDNFNKYTETKTTPMTFSFSDDSLDMHSKVYLTHTSVQKTERLILPNSRKTLYNITTVQDDVSGTIYIKNDSFEFYLSGPSDSNTSQPDSYVRNSGKTIAIRKITRPVVLSDLVVGYELIYRDTTIALVDKLHDRAFLEDNLDKETHFLIINIITALI